jgi:Zn-dependent protease
MSPLLAIIIGLALLVPAIAVAVPVHEMGHAAAAYLLGDRSVRYFGYFTIDPRRFLEPVGVLAIFLGLVGWGRRVPIQANRINTTTKKVLYELGGPGANLLVALVVGQVLRAMFAAGYHLSFDVLNLALLGIVYVIVFLNLSLFAFNLLPIPGLDGWNIIEDLFRSRWPKFFFEVHVRQREIWAGLVLILILFQFFNHVNLLNPIMSPFFQPASLISTGLCIPYGVPYINFLIPCLL